MTPLAGAAIVVGLLLTVGCALFVLHVSRVRSLSGRVGSFPSQIREVGSPRWQPGITHYGADRLEWFALFSMSPRPRHVWPRSSFQILDRRPLDNDGTWRERGDLSEILCESTSARDGDRQFVLVLTVNAYEGLSSWLEAAPPGHLRG